MKVYEWLHVILHEKQQVIEHEYTKSIYMKYAKTETRDMTCNMKRHGTYKSDKVNVMPLTRHRVSSEGSFFFHHV